MNILLRNLKYITLGICIVFIPSTSALGQQAPDNRATNEANKAVLKYFPFDDKSDMERARHGFIAILVEPVIKKQDGTLVYDTYLYNFMEGIRIQFHQDHA